MTKRKKIAKGVRRRVYESDNWSCWFCGVTIRPQTQSQTDGTHAPVAEDGTWLELDHIVPHSTGGLDTVDNLRAACTRCNKLKSDSTHEADWNARIGAALAVLTVEPRGRAAAQKAARLLTGSAISLDRHGRVINE